MTKQDENNPYNPLDKTNLARSVGERLLNKQPQLLGEMEAFVGAGIYAIYYTGEFLEYNFMTTQNTDNKFEAPIYIGKAVPKGARIGLTDIDPKPGQVLFNRLREHADSIRQANNLNINDFWCRYLVVDDIWIPLGESLLINKFRPLWNVSLSGFGNHDPGGGRYAQQRSPWDTLHEGRSWAYKCVPYKMSKDEILDNLKQHNPISDEIES